MSGRIVSYQGTLVRVYKPNRPARSVFNTPAFDDDLDFDSYRMLGRGTWPASRVTYERKYELLSEIFDLIRKHAAGQFSEMLVYSRMPSIMRMPKPLFGPDVFFLLGLDDEAQRLQPTGLSFLTIREGFVRHALEDGDNQITVRWFNAPDLALVAMQEISKALEALGIAEHRLEECLP